MWRNMFYYGIAMVVGMPLSVSAAGENCAGVSYLSVPENRSVVNSPKIKVAYKVYAATANVKSKDAVIVLGGGGPGGAVNYEIKRNELKGISIDAGRDLILMDYRGVGCSKPSLDCRELDNQSWEQELTAIRACAKRLSDKGRDLPSYNTTTLAQDVEALRKHLGYGALNLTGPSYGSRLALRFMELYPSRTRSAVLVSPYPYGVDIFADRLADTRAILSKLFGDDDAAQRKISALIAKGGDLPTMMENLATNILIDSYGMNIEAPVTDITRFLRPPPIKIFGPGHDTSLYEGVFFSVTCSEDMAPLNQAKLNAAASDSDHLLKMAAAMFRRSIQRQVEACAIWPVSSQNATVNTSAITPPVLLVVPEYDFHCAPSWTERLAAALPNAEILPIPGKGHSQGTAHPRVKAFIEHPKKKSQR